MNIGNFTKQWQENTLAYTLQASKVKMICFDINQVDLKGPDCDFQDQTDMLFKNITPESTSGKPWLKGFLTHCSLAISVGRFFSSPLLLCTENQDLILYTQDVGGQGWSYLHPPTAPSSRSTARSNLKGVWFCPKHFTHY